MRRLLISAALFAAFSISAALGAGEPKLSEAAKAKTLQGLSSALQRKRITQQEYAQAISWVNSTPCVGIERGLTEERQIELGTAIKKQLQLEKIDILGSFQNKGSTIIYVDTHDADEAYLFYTSDPVTSLNPVSEWSGAAMIFETSAIEQWVLENTPGIPKELASCFAWHVTLDRE